MSKYIWVGKVYADWFREPLSPLEKTWRFPFLFREGRKFIKQRLHLTVPTDFYQIKDGYIYIRNDWFKLFLQAGSLIALVKFIIDLFTEKENWEKDTLKKYSKIIKEWYQLDPSSKTNHQLWNLANEIMKKDTYYSIKTVYIGLYSIVLEILLRWFYRIFVNDKFRGYQQLLIGFPNKNHEMNSVLYDLAQLQSGNPKLEKKLFEFIHNFGLRKTDWDIVLPTFAEKKETILQLIKLYQENPELNPNKKLEEAAEQRKQKVKFVYKSLKFKLLTQPFFNWLLKYSCEYIPLREERAFWGGSGIFFVRRCLNLLGEKLDLEPDMIYYLEKQELEKLLDSKLEIPKAKSLAQERFKLREKQKEKLPL